MASLTIDTPTGPVLVTEQGGQIVRLEWQHKTRHADPSPVLQQARRQIQEYFEGQRTTFDLPLAPPGGLFQRTVCEQIRQIPFGETTTYGEIAKRLGVSAQAVGRACGGNPIPLIIACHRVLASNGLGGFSGGVGIETKVQLLRHEGAGGLLI
ncbi:MAG: cysteine methyltransferase [Rhodobacterales bacterium]|nr:MAG: cysteine methyltransferase [Rhodobacterales bacterium]